MDIYDVARNAGVNDTVVFASLFKREREDISFSLFMFPTSYLGFTFVFPLFRVELFSLLFLKGHFSFCNQPTFYFFTTVNQ